MVTKKVTLIKTVGGNTSGTICLPKFLIGKEVEITFTQELTEEELKKIELNRTYEELKKIREKRRKR